MIGVVGLAVCAEEMGVLLVGLAGLIADPDLGVRGVFLVADAVTLLVENTELPSDPLNLATPFCPFLEVGSGSVIRVAPSFLK